MKVTKLFDLYEKSADRVEEILYFPLYLPKSHEIAEKTSNEIKLKFTKTNTDDLGNLRDVEKITAKK